MGQPEVSAQSSEKRVKNFNEVSQGYSKKIVIEEAIRCPQCADPVCMSHCPLNINIPSFIRFLREGQIAEAYQKIYEKSCLPAVCGRICSAPCEAACVLNDEKSPIGIRTLERFAVDVGRRGITKKKLSSNGKKIAIVGSGPAGLSAAKGLAEKGYLVTIFESMEKAGGVLRYGIPDFRLSKKVLDKEIEHLLSLGIKLKVNSLIGQIIALDELWKDNFAAILLATGAGVPKISSILGTSYAGVFYGEEFLMRACYRKTQKFSKPKVPFALGPRVAVIGTSDTALDCARTAVRFGRDVVMLISGTEEDMTVDYQERDFSKDEGVRIEPMVKVVEILADQNHFVTGVKCIRVDYADPESTGDWQLMIVPDSEFVVDVDAVVLAKGNEPNGFLKRQESKLKFNRDGTLKLNKKNSMTSISKIFGCGDVVTKSGRVVDSMASGIDAAKAIDEYLK